jgi:hypothetical protein
LEEQSRSGVPRKEGKQTWFGWSDGWVARMRENTREKGAPTPAPFFAELFAVPAGAVNSAWARIFDGYTALYGDCWSWSNRIFTHPTSSSTYPLPIPLPLPIPVWRTHCLFDTECKTDSTTRCPFRREARLFQTHVALGRWQPGPSVFRHVTDPCFPSRPPITASIPPLHGSCVFSRPPRAVRSRLASRIHFPNGHMRPPWSTPALPHLSRDLYNFPRAPVRVPSHRIVALKFVPSRQGRNRAAKERRRWLVRSRPPASPPEARPRASSSPPRFVSTYPYRSAVPIPSMVPVVRRR